VLAVEQLLVALGGEDGFPGDLLRQLDAAVVEIAGADALDAGKLDRGPHQARALHPDADHAEAYRVARRNGPRGRRREAVSGFAVSVRVEHDGIRGQRRPRSPGHEIATRHLFYAHV